MKRILYAIGIIIAGTSVANAQQFSCATDHYYHQLVEKDPSIVKDLETLIANGQHEKDDEDSTTIFTIPVVFHVLHQNGVENIPDANIINQIDILNRDYMTLNADTSNVIPEFQGLIGKARIQFKLASYDPWGNCTNGIDRIYTHETTNGGAYSKLNQWDRSKYLNIWVVKAMPEVSGAAGYALYPTAVNGYAFWMDGIVVLYNYVGSLAPSSAYNSRAITHEVGHWLALPHVWGDNNDPGVACGDDGIDDTPMTKGYTTCPAPSAAMICDTAIVENYQNYMDYSYCSYMFTKGQVKVMRRALQGQDGLRANLITPATHQATGIDLTTPPVCIPTPDIKADKLFTCAGETVQFTDQSFNGPVTYREWIFEDGTPATSTAANPSVTFNSWGMKKVTLKVGNASGETTKVFNQFIDVQPSWGDSYGPKSFNLEPATQYQQLRYLNEGDNYSKFVPANVGYNSNKSLKLTVYKPGVENALPGSDDAQYYNRLGGQKDAIITPTFDLRNTTGITFSFDYSYASNAIQSADITEQIRVYYSRNCGDTWTPLGNTTQSTIKGAALASAGYAGGVNFAPTSANDWGHYSQAFNATSSDSRTRFKIEFTASDFSSNLYIDNINVNGTLGLVDEFTANNDLVIAPNPIVAGNDLNIQYTAGNEPVTFTLRNLQGEIITSVVRNDVNQPVSFGMAISSNVAASYYFLEISSNTSKTVKKIAVIK